SVGLASTIEDVQTFLALVHNAYHDRNQAPAYAPHVGVESVGQAVGDPTTDPCVADAACH
ncbi:MAG TPA: hypothetical protein VGR98_07460, partial [Streptosporangiaceae bacterium]|nr:hypothetical protein [Streptosporangiaceae bacterium]